MTVTKAEAATFVRDTARELSKIANEFDFDALTYLLEMAALEADCTLSDVPTARHCTKRRSNSALDAGGHALHSTPAPK